MSTNSAINALTRFKSRFPGLETITSDNGTNFVGVANELKDELKRLEDDQKLHEKLADKGITWRFGPPNAPHWGGVWERLVKSTKRHLLTSLPKEPDVDTLETILAEVASILNKRPLTYASTNIECEEVLCPNNFLFPYLHSSASCNILPYQPNEGDFLRASWRQVRKTADDFWNRWQKEYLETLRRRTKWEKSADILYVGRIVLVVDENAPRDQWRTGVIEEIHGDDAHQREAIVRFANGKRFRRHQNALVVLELQNS